jgi:hypothetical protein
MQAKTFALLMSLLIFAGVLDLIRRQKMTFKYSLTWLAASLGVLFFAANEGLLQRLSRLAGFALPSNFVFFMLLVFFVLVCLLLTLYINEQNSRGESLGQAVALLEYKLKKLEEKSKNHDQSTPPGSAG